MEGMSNRIVCDDCSKELEPAEIEFKHVDIVINETTFEVVFYNCPSCGRAYVVCMLDYWARKLQKKYISAIDGYRTAYNGDASKVMLKQKAKKVEVAKSEAMSYQQELLQKYGTFIPEGSLV